ncbi:hypothetical protein [Paracoccus shanxieyensis]|nr:hypothetical protein [Paracoccus shanxieyensis]
MTTDRKDAKKAAPTPAAQAALEQMFGYFSFQPMPTEREEERLAA